MPVGPQRQSSPPPAALAASALRPRNVLAIAVSAISPTTSVFLIYGDGLQIAGTGIVWAFVIGSAIALCMALCYAEVGSVFPSAGGAYTIVRRAIGPVWGGATTALFLLLGVVSTAAILVAAATYLSLLIGSDIPAQWLALAMMALITALSVGKIAPASWVIAVILVLELAVIIAFAVLALGHVSHATNPFTEPVTLGPGGALVGVGIAGIFAAVGPALFAFNGYDWPLYFSEETSGSRSAIPRAVVLSAVLAIVFEGVAVIAATLAIRDVPNTIAAGSPVELLARQMMGPTGATLLVAGVVVAMFDTGLAANLGYARVYYAAARDGMLPRQLQGFFGRLSEKSRVPVRGFLFLFVGNGLLCVFISLHKLITFTGVVIAIVYLLVAVSAIVCRMRDRDVARPFRMPLWPLPPVLAIAGIVVTLGTQQVRDLAIGASLVTAAAVGYLIARRRLPPRLNGGTITRHSTR
ncbi:putative amino acid permease YhdG [Mycobacterium basiliense]|uniref:Putative amino acid permease YhdG n=1 Tax=Mycobacterium basiliense TaxID=2094119 RepID=A0A447GCT3_9MYCO|nr:APC family permease [Mycobacterium basiliense]VDM88317.1 putative amino acid permease YhdG [Mycobacterium basiliense]